MKQDVAMYVKQCDICGAVKEPIKTPKAPLGHLSSGPPWGILATGYRGPFPETPRGNRYIFILTDPFS